MKTKENIARARKVRQIQADIDRRTESIYDHRIQIAKKRAELKSVKRSR